jgi:hypothetical protein
LVIGLLYSENVWKINEALRSSRISDLIGVSPHIVAGILYRLRHRGRLRFQWREDCHDGLDPEYRFTLPTEMPEQIERTRVWATKEVKKR